MHTNTNTNTNAAPLDVAAALDRTVALINRLQPWKTDGCQSLHTLESSFRLHLATSITAEVHTDTEPVGDSASRRVTLSFPIAQGTDVQSRITEVKRRLRSFAIEQSSREGGTCLRATTAIDTSDEDRFSRDLRHALNRIRIVASQAGLLNWTAAPECPRRQHRNSILGENSPPPYRPTFPFPRRGI